VAKLEAALTKQQAIEGLKELQLESTIPGAQKTLQRYRGGLLSNDAVTQAGELLNILDDK
jgi:hypothetical protein